MKLKTIFFAMIAAYALAVLVAAMLAPG